MLDAITVAPAPDQPVSGDRRRRWWLSVLALLLMVTSGVLLSRGMTAAAPAAHPAAAEPSSAAPSAVAPPSGGPLPAEGPAAPLRESATATLLPGLLQLPGAVPPRGSGSFRYASTRGPAHGTQGVLRRFRVAVEQGSNEDPDQFAALVDRVLGDGRSWIGEGRVRLQMVAGADAADFTVHLATRETAYRMCRRGGTDIRVGGVPYTSCRTEGHAVLNLDRWRLSAPPFVAAKVPLAVYREYVINHEVGHELGHHHQGCPKAGGPAPVMVQQTLTLRGCRPYAWPRAGTKMLTGPAR